jgi:hypothetical protein
MAKKTLSEILKLAFGSKLDEEIDIDLAENKGNNEESTVSEKQKEVKTIANKEVENKETVEVKDEKTDKEEKAEDKDMVDTKIFEEGWLDTTSGKINFEKIKNPETLEAIKTLSGMYQAEKEQRLISDSLSETLKSYSLTVSEDTFKKVLDTSGVKIDKEGKVVGIKEAIESLRTSEPGFFKDKEKESNPLNEGFNPVEKPTATTDDELVSLAYGQ